MAHYENMSEGNNCKVVSLINQNQELHKLELHSFKNLWLQDALLEERSYLPDIDFITSDKCIVKAHRSILCIFSSMVRRMMENISCCQSIAILLPDCSSQALVHVLNMISTGESLEDNSESLSGLSESELKDVEGAATVLGIEISVVRKTEDWNSFGDPESGATAVGLDDDVEILDVVAVVNQVNDELTKGNRDTDYIKSEPKEEDFEYAMENVLVKQSGVNTAVKSKKLKRIEKSSKNRQYRDTLLDNAYDEVMEKKSVEESEVMIKEEMDIPDTQLAIEAPVNITNEKPTLFENDEQAATTPNEETDNILKMIEETGNILKMNEENDIMLKMNEETNTLRMTEENDSTFSILNTDVGSKVENDKTVDKVDNEYPHKNSCQICTNGRNFENPNQLIQHYVFHFKKELKENFFHFFADSLCLLCSKNIRNENKFAHIGATHKKVNDILVQKGLEQVTSLRQGLKQDKPNLQENKPEGVSTEIEAQSGSMVGKTCTFCQKEFRNNFQTVDHLSKVHFQAEILQKYAKNGNVCIFCGVDAMIPARLASHLGYSHRKIDEFIGEKTQNDLTGRKSVEKESTNFAPEQFKEENVEMADSKKILTGTTNMETVDKTEKIKAKRTSCGKCENCTRKDCRQCVNCKDMKKFGGPALIKKKCKQKKCLNPSLPSPRHIIPRILSERVGSELPKQDLPRVISEPTNKTLSSKMESAKQNITNEVAKATSEELSESDSNLAMEEATSEEPLRIPIEMPQSDNAILDTTLQNEVETHSPVSETASLDTYSESNLDSEMNSNTEINEPGLLEISNHDSIIDNRGFTEVVAQNSNLVLNNSEINREETPSDNELQSQMSENLSPQNHESQNSNKITDSTETITHEESIPKAEDLECFVCDRCFSTQTDLYRHYSLKHYFEQICEKYPQQPFCPVPDCHAKTKQRMAWVRHLGQVHEVVQDFLPEQFWVEREEINEELRPVKEEPSEENTETETEYVNPMTVGENKDEHLPKIEENVPTTGDQMNELLENSNKFEDIKKPESPKVSKIQENIETSEFLKNAQIAQSLNALQPVKTSEDTESLNSEQNIETSELRLRLNSEQNVETSELRLVHTPKLSKKDKKGEIQTPKLSKKLNVPDVPSEMAKNQKVNSNVSIQIPASKLAKNLKTKQNVQTSDIQISSNLQQNIQTSERTEKSTFQQKVKTPELQIKFQLPELVKNPKIKQNVKITDKKFNVQKFTKMASIEPKFQTNKVQKPPQNVQALKLSKNSKVHKPDLTKISNIKQKIEILDSKTQKTFQALKLIKNSKPQQIAEIVHVQAPKSFKKSKLQQNERTFAEPPIIDITNSEETFESKYVAEPNRSGKRKFGNASGFNPKYEEPKKRIVAGINNKKINYAQDEISSTLKSTIKDIQFSDNAKNEQNKKTEKRMTRKSRNFRYTE